MTGEPTFDADHQASPLAPRVVAVWCPDWSVPAGDPDRAVRSFEPVVAAVEALAPGVEVVHPGLVAVPARGPVRYFGSEPEVAERIVDVVAAQTGVRCRVGIADGLFAATLAAHRGLLVPPGASAGFLATLGIGELRHPVAGGVRAGLVDLLHRLGLRSLGAFAALPVDDVASRFGAAAVRAHRLARGFDERPVTRRRPPADPAAAPGLWGGPGEDDELAGRALGRVQGMLGPDAVLTGVPGGGRDPGDRIHLVPWGQDPNPHQPDAGPGAGTELPWPGRLPAPSPSQVPPRPLPAEVLDDAGRLVGVSGRGVLTGVPHRVVVDGHPPRRVLSWAGPWLVEERWWEPGGGRRCARLQAVLDAEPGAGRSGEPLAVLLVCQTGRWRVEGIYW